MNSDFLLKFITMRATFPLIVLLIAFTILTLVSTACTPTGTSNGAALSNGYQAPQSSSPVDQTDSLRSQYRDWIR